MLQTSQEKHRQIAAMIVCGFPHVATNPSKYLHPGVVLCCALKRAHILGSSAQSIAHSGLGPKCTQHVSSYFCGS